LVLYINVAMRALLKYFSFIVLCYICTEAYLPVTLIAGLGKSIPTWHISTTFHPLTKLFKSRRVDIINPSNFEENIKKLDEVFSRSLIDRILFIMSCVSSRPNIKSGVFNFLTIFPKLLGKFNENLFGSVSSIYLGNT